MKDQSEKDPAQQPVEIGVKLPDDVGMEREWLWALPSGDEHYTIANIPFFAYDVNYGDLVRGETDGDGRLMLAEVVEPSGHKTFRLIFDQGIAPEVEADAVKVLDGFAVMREKGMGSIHAITVPPDADLPGVFRFLIEKQDQGVLSFELAESYDEDEDYEEDNED